MARVLLILSIVLILISAGLGFVAKQKVDILNSTLSQRTSELNSTKAKLKKTEDDLKATQAELATTKTQLEEKTAEAAKAKAELDDATKKLAEATTQLEAKTKALADVEDQLKALQAGNEGKNLKEVIEQMKSDLDKARTELEEAKQVQVTLTQRAKDADEKAVALEGVVNAYKYKVVKPGLTGKVLAYNPGWNFVVLSIGDKAGLKSGVNMLVQRGNSMIAKLKVTTVEPNTAIADVLPGSMRGAKVQPGDTVIYEVER